MKLSDVQARLNAPFPAHIVSWKPGAISKDRKRALMLAHIDARAVQDRLDAICPDAWSFEVEVVAGTRLPTIKGRLTVLGVSREDIGEAPEGDLSTLKAASSDALKRCAVHFGIGRYLYDLPKQWAEWDDAKRTPTSTPDLPDWARPDHERSPGGAHLAQAMEQLRYELPQDLDLQREVYKHLKAALGSLHPETSSSGAGRARESDTEGDPAATALTEPPISVTTKQSIAAYLEGPRWNLQREERLAFTAYLAHVPPLRSSEELTETQGQTVLGRLQTCRTPGVLLEEWRAAPPVSPRRSPAQAVH